MKYYSMLVFVISGIKNERHEKCPSTQFYVQGIEEETKENNEDFELQQLINILSSLVSNKTWMTLFETSQPKKEIIIKKEQELF